MKPLMILLLWASNIFAASNNLLNMEGNDLYEMMSPKYSDKVYIYDTRAKEKCRELKKGYEKAMKSLNKDSEQYLELDKQKDMVFFIGWIMDNKILKSLYNSFLDLVEFHSISLKGVEHIELFTNFFRFLRNDAKVDPSTASFEDLSKYMEGFICKDPVYGKIFNQGMFTSWAKVTQRARKTAGGFQLLGWGRSLTYASKTGLLACGVAIGLLAYGVSEQINSNSPAKEPLVKEKTSMVDKPNVPASPDEKEMTLDEYLEKRGKELRRPLPEGTQSDPTKNAP